MLVCAAMIYRSETHGQDAALQAYLEADPATRTTKDEYIMRYQCFAKSGLEKAIQKYEGLYTHIGVCINALFRAQMLSAHLSPANPHTLQTGSHLGDICCCPTSVRHPISACFSEGCSRVHDLVPVLCICGCTHAPCW